MSSPGFLPAADASTRGGRRRAAAVAALLFLATLLLYARAFSFGFVAYDDDAYVLRNPHVNTGLSAENLRWALTTEETGYRHPATWVSHQADVQLFGLDGGRHHVANVLLHATNAVLVLVLLSRATRRFWASAFVAAVFALHPLHVESVAWVAQRKDVLSAFFGLLAAIAWVRYAERPSVARYVAVAALFVAALAAKPMLVTLPVLLLLLDAWPLARIRSATELRARIVEKVPLLLLSVAASILTYLSQSAGGSVSSLEAIPWPSRIANAFGSYFAYLGKIVWPHPLAVLYPFPDGVPSTARVLGLATAFLAVTVLFVRLGAKRPVLRVGWLWFVVALLPVIGIVHVGVQSMADRYVYLAILGPSMMVAYVVDARAASPVRVRAVSVAAAAVLLACAVVTWRHLPTWRDSETLFRGSLEATTGNYFLMQKYGTFLTDAGRPAEALPLFEEAIRLRPRVADLRVNYGNALTALSETTRAIEQYDAALAIDADSALAHYNRAVAHAARGEDEAAIDDYRAAVRIRPDFAEAHCNLGCIALRMQRPGLALAALERAVALAPKDRLARRQLAVALATLGRRADAIAQLRAVVASDPSDADTWTALGLLLEADGRTEDAISAYRRALSASPADPAALSHLRRLGRSPSD